MRLGLKLVFQPIHFPRHTFQLGLTVTFSEAVTAVELASFR
jgi:hypothetical protein